VYIENFSIIALEDSWIKNYYKNLTLYNSGTMIHHTYFITNDKGYISLATFEWFGEYCNKIYLYLINEFDKSTQKWSKKMENYEKFRNFQGCELVMVLPINLGGYETVGGSFTPQKDNSFLLQGLTPMIFEVAAKWFNFQPTFQPIFEKNLYVLKAFRFAQIIYVSDPGKKSKQGHVFFHYEGIQGLQGLNAIGTSVFANDKIRVLATLPELYTPYEKLLLPFDTQTWILLIVTFLLTFVTILIINKLSETAQNIIYGKKVKTPIWNVISIFFGVSQTKLPTENFSRYILTIFIVFCLIFRSCWQSKSFEYMTSEPLRTPPKTIQDLVDRNYTIVTANKIYIDNLLGDDIGKWYENVLFEFLYKICRVLLIFDQFWLLFKQF
jgi:hypothetical protein